MLEGPDRTQLVSLLAWYGELGIDSVLADEPLNWMERPGTAPGEAVRAALSGAAHQGTGTAPTSPSPPPSPPPTPNRRATGGEQPPRTQQASRFTPVTPQAAGAGSARQAAAAVNSLSELRAALERFEGCALKATAKNTCVYRGAEQARIMIIGEAPGRDEDLEGRPFVGRAGKLLDRMLGAIDLSENDVHITNIVYWRPPGNRTPTPQEAQVCRPFLDRQIQLVAPEIILVLGGAAAKSMFNASEGIMRLRGKWKQIEVGDASIKAFASLHPAYLLRTPAAKRLAWRDLLNIREALSKSSD